MLGIYGNFVLAAAHNTIVGVFRVRGTHRDQAAGGQVVFDLTPAPEWEWAIGKNGPVHRGRHDRDPFKKVGEGSVKSLLVQHPNHRPAGCAPLGT